MKKEEAKAIIESALDKAMQRGVYTLQDAVIILQSLTTIFEQEEKE